MGKYRQHADRIAEMALHARRQRQQEAEASAQTAKDNVGDLEELAADLNTALKSRNIAAQVSANLG